MSVSGSLNVTTVNTVASNIRASAWTPAVYRVLWNYSPAPGPRLIVDNNEDPTLATLTGTGTQALQVQDFKAEVVSNRPGTYLGQFGEDFYDRIHYQFLELNLGNLLGVQERTLWVWNAFRRTRLLEALSFSAFDGIQFSGNTPPTLYTPLQQRTYAINVSLDGPAVIDATVTFDWDEDEEQPVEIVGNRIITWSWQPDWKQPIVERLEWKTDVLQSYRGQEQRRALRRAPRRFCEFYAGGNEAERRIMETALWGWGGRIWAMPLWWDGCDTTAPVALGATRVDCPAPTRDFKPGEPAILFKDWQTYETVEIDAAYSDHVTLVRPTAQSWPEGTRIYPARAARIDGNVALDRFDGAASFQRMRWQFEAAADYTAAAGTATHNGYPVLEVRPNWVDEPSLEYERKLAIFDAMVGRRSIEDEALIPLTVQRQRYTFTTRAEIDEWRQRLYSMRGKQASVYVPTWTRDLDVVAIIQSNALAIDVAKTNYASLIAQDAGRKNIRIKLTSGQVFYRAITGSLELNPTTERININSSLGVQALPEDVESVMFMALARLDSDGVELSWWSGDVCNSSVALRTFNHDI